MNSPRTTRINLLYERLKSTNGIRIGDLAREFEVSTKTIARDFRIEISHIMGIKPLIYEYISHINI